MTVTDVWLEIDEKQIIQALQEAREKLDGAHDEVILNFASVPRIDASAVNAIEALAAVAEDKGIKVVLRGVNVDIYKVLKLAKLSSRFSFAN